MTGYLLLVCDMENTLHIATFLSEKCVFPLPEGATNRPQEIDEAARRRLVKRLYIPLPDGPARKQIILGLLKEQKHCLSEADMDELCHKTAGLWHNSIY